MQMSALHLILVNSRHTRLFRLLQAQNDPFAKIDANYCRVLFRKIHFIITQGLIKGNAGLNMVWMLNTRFNDSFFPPLPCYNLYWLHSMFGTC